MSKSRISFNVNAQFLGDSAYFKDVVRNLVPASITIMHGRELALEIWRITEGKTTPIFRTDVDKDRDLLKMTPAAYVDMYVKNGNGYPKSADDWGLMGYVLNEPAPAPGQGVTWQTIVKWLTEVGYRLADKNLPASIGNIGPGTFEKADVENGTFDPLLKMFHDTGKMHSFGIHEYTGILLPFGVGQWPREWLVDKTKVQPEQWPRNLPRQRTSDGQLPPYWHLRRSDWLMIRCQEKGWSLPTVDMTEYGADRMPDLTLGGQFNPYNVLQQQYGLVSPHQTYRGFSSLRNVYEAFFPQWGFDRTVFEQLKWTDEIYPDNYRAFHVFTWSRGTDDWDRQFGTDVSRFKTLHTLLIDYANRTTTPPPPPDPTPAPNPVVDDPRFANYRIATTAKGGANVRITSSIGNTTIVGTIAEGGVIVPHIPYDKLTTGEKLVARPGDGFEWYLVRVLKMGKQYVGWVRNDVVSKPELVVVEPPPVDTDRETLEDWLTREKGQLVELNILIDRLTPALNSALALRVTCVENITDLERKLEETP